MARSRCARLSREASRSGVPLKLSRGYSLLTFGRCSPLQELPVIIFNFHISGNHTVPHRRICIGSAKGTASVTKALPSQRHKPRLEQEFAR